MKVSEIKEMNPDELQGELETLERRLFEVRTQAVTEKLEDTSLRSKIRKDIARIKTVMREQKMATAAQAEQA